MKKLLLAAILLSAFTMSHAQDSWKIKLNGKIIFTAAGEDEIKNTKSIKRTELARPGTLDVLYKESIPQESWRRSLLFFDENDNQLFVKDSVTAVTKINNATLKKLFTDKKKLRIYTIATPTDPDLAARVRLRRVHLVTIDLQ
jgi:hypothetical protein